MELIEQGIAKFGSAASLAKALDVHESMISQIKTKRRPMPPLMAGRLGELLELNPLECVVKTLEEQAVKKEERRAWHSWLRLVAHTAVAVFAVVGLSGFWPSEAQASRGTFANEKGPEIQGQIFNASKVNRFKTAFTSIVRAVNEWWEQKVRRGAGVLTTCPYG